MIKILVAGKTHFNYNRTKVLLDGLKAHQEVDLIEYSFSKKNSETGKILHQMSLEVDFIFIPSFRHTDVKFAKKYTNKPIIFDPLVSNYLTKVVDYGHYWKAPLKYISDYFPMKKADILVADTEHHKRYFHKKFHIPLEKIIVVPVGVNTDEFQPLPSVKKSDTTIIGFYGSFVPLQGTLKIIETARLLRDRSDIQFKIIGTGYHYQKALDLVKKYQLTNIDFLGWVKYDELSDHLQTFDLCLGIFGDSLKADYVIPNKIFHYAALGKCIITKDTPGIREAFTENDLVMVNNTPEEMAKAILDYKDNTTQQIQLGKNINKKTIERFSHHQIAESLINGIKKIYYH